MLAIWRRVPTTLGAVILAFVLLSAGTIPWAILARINVRTTPAIPWSAAVMAVYLWVYWRYAQGAGWPEETAEARRRCARAFQLPARTWAAALVAGAQDHGA